MRSGNLVKVFGWADNEAGYATRVVDLADRLAENGVVKILIADSGSTKCDWLAITEHGQELGEFHTMGFNPYFHDADLVEREMRNNSQAMAMADSVDRVYFYGAGSSSPELCAVIAEGLRRVFPEPWHGAHGRRGLQHPHRGACRDVRFGTAATAHV